MTTDADSAASERKNLAAMFSLFATSRELDGDVHGDARYTAAANALRQIAATLDRISDADLLLLGRVNLQSEGLLSQLIAQRVSEVGFALPCYTNAPEFFAPILIKVDEILRDARAKLNREADDPSASHLH